MTTNKQAKSARAITVRTYLVHIGGANGKKRASWAQLENWHGQAVQALEACTNPLKRGDFLQRINELEAQMDSYVDTDHEAEFIKVAAKFQQDRGWSWATFRELGVPARVLKEAGVVK